MMIDKIVSKMLSLKAHIAKLLLCFSIDWFNSLQDPDKDDLPSDMVRVSPTDIKQVCFSFLACY